MNPDPSKYRKGIILENSPSLSGLVRGEVVYAYEEDGSIVVYDGSKRSPWHITPDQIKFIDEGTNSMKSVAEEKEEEVVEQEYPCIMDCTERINGPFTTLFTSESCGVVIWEKGSSHKLGYYGRDWDMSCFAPTTKKSITIYSLT